MPRVVCVCLTFYSTREGENLANYSLLILFTLATQSSEKRAILHDLPRSRWVSGKPYGQGKFCWDGAIQASEKSYERIPVFSESTRPLDRGE